MTHEMLGDRVLAKIIQLEKKTAAGLILSGTTEEEERDTVFARVIAVGEGKYFDNGSLKPTKCKEGDIVVYRDNMGLKYKAPDGSGTFDVLNESNILMIIRGEDLVETTENYHVKAFQQDPTLLR